MFPSDRSDLCIAVVGVGRWGQNVFRDLQACSGARVVAVCDPDSARLSSVPSAATELARLSTFSDLLSCQGIDAVALCSPAETHFELCLASLVKGLHVFVEKPFCLSSREGRLLVDMANQRDKTLVVGHQMLYHWGVEWLRRVLSLGLIGAPIGLASTRHNSIGSGEGVGPWWSLAPHDLAILLDLFPHAVLDVELSDHPPADEPPACSWANAVVRLEGGLSARISCAVGALTKTRRVAVEGSAGVAVFDETDGKGRVELYLRDGRGVLRMVEPCARPELERFGAVNDGVKECVPPLRLECEDFVHCTIGGAVPRSSGAAALRVVELLEAGAEALAQRRIVRLDAQECSTRGPVIW